MNIKIKNSIIEVLRPVTNGDADLERTVNILILNGIEKAIDDGFTGIDMETVEKLQKEHIIKNMLQDVPDALNDD